MSDLAKHASLISELLANAGWLDEPGEMLAYITKPEEALAKAHEVMALIRDINPHLPQEERIREEDLTKYV